MTSIKKSHAKNHTTLSHTEITLR